MHKGGVGGAPRCRQAPSAAGWLQELFEGLDCDDATPTCAGTCGKLLECGEHSCVQRCHPGGGTPPGTRSTAPAAPWGLHSELWALGCHAQRHAPRLSKRFSARGCSCAGPCPVCRAVVVKACACGRSQKQVACATTFRSAAQARPACWPRRTMLIYHLHATNLALQLTTAGPEQVAVWGPKQLRSECRSATCADCAIQGLKESACPVSLQVQHPGA